MNHDSPRSAFSCRRAACVSREEQASRLHAILILALLASFSLGAAGCGHRGDPLPVAESRAGPPPDPRLAYTGPFQNVRPDVPYVGDAKCAECHAEITASYQRHPMGRSLLPIRRATPRPPDDAAANNPLETLGVLLRVEHQGERVLHRQIGRDDKGQAVYTFDLPVDYVLGSGTHGHSYLTNRDGYLFQTPISWYSQKRRWDKSPGFAVETLSGRPVTGRCLFCHANRARWREGYVNRYDEPVFDGYAIGCERCHGPGGRHLDNPSRKDATTGIDYTILNPRHLDAKRRAAVCEQCHLAGEARILRRGRGLYDFRPGLPLEDFWSIFVSATESESERKAVGHVEQMVLSQCYLHSADKPDKGKRKLGCTSCHDPHRHVAAEERVAYYRQRCLACHHEQGCRLPPADRLRKNPSDSCIDCHMPRYASTDIAHTASTDHRILRHGGAAASVAAQPPSRAPRFVSFHRDLSQSEDKESERDRAIVMVGLFAEGKTNPVGAAGKILDLLTAAVSNDPDDLDAREAKAAVWIYLERPVEALAEYEAVLARAPHREVSLAGAAAIAQKQKRLELALAYWRRAVEANPYCPSYRAHLAQLLSSRNNWDEARPHCQAWLRLDASNVEARALWVRCLLKTGAHAEAQAEFATIRRLRPPNLPLLEARFAVEFRAR